MTLMSYNTWYILMRLALSYGIFLRNQERFSLQHVQSVLASPWASDRHDFANIVRLPPL